MAVMFTTALFTNAADTAEKTEILLVTGDDVAPFHDWHGMSQATREVLVDSGKFNVRVCEDPMILESAAALEKYDAIFMSIYNASLPTISDEAKENLLNFVKNGKGIIISHLTSASFKEWPEFKELCGRYWVMGTSGHGPRGVFQAQIKDKDHPITEGLEDFRVFDELYAKLQGDADIHVLVEAESDWSGNTEPLVFTRKYGKGRVLHETFGHDRKAIMDPSVKKIIINGCQWAAKAE
ncbi:MAG: ThuA domain-containing protein [Verrucomicrobia bacterium]|nr:ThuA domain-containing protein [Verrucomicrobiota bacterium]